MHGFTVYSGPRCSAQLSCGIAKCEGCDVPHRENICMKAASLECIGAAGHRFTAKEHMIYRKSGVYTETHAKRGYASIHCADGSPRGSWDLMLGISQSRSSGLLGAGPESQLGSGERSFLNVFPVRIGSGGIVRC